MKRSNLFIMAASVLMAFSLFGCAQATSSSSSSSPSTTSSALVATMTLQAQSSNWPNAYVAVTPNSANTTGITAATIVWAVDSNAFGSLFTGATMQSKAVGGWNSTNSTVTAANTWLTYTWTNVDSGTTSTSAETSAIVLNVWNSTSGSKGPAAFTGENFYVKSFQLTYTDGAKEVITFVDGTGTNVHSVYTPASGSATASNDTVANRIWHWADTSSGLTVSLGESTSLAF